jgi:iron-sulfur cluster repair protein YtfE (RIC family)
MLRNKNLIPLSHQHQRALALCVRIERASPIPAADLNAWQNEITQLCRNEIMIHFAAEEALIFPVARRLGELASLVDELLEDHAVLRDRFALAEAHVMKATDLSEFARRLSAHIRKEERMLFEGMQELMSAEELNDLGRQLEEALKESAQSCVIPTAATKLQPANAKGSS